MSEESERVPVKANLRWMRLNCPRRHVVPSNRLRTVDPIVGQEYWCPRCTCMAEITEMIPKDALRLVTCSCKTFSRNYGVADLRARVGATKHAERYPGHTVTLIDGNGKLLQTSEWEQRTLLDSPDY